MIASDLVTGLGCVFLLLVPLSSCLLQMCACAHHVFLEISMYFWVVKAGRMCVRFGIWRNYIVLCNTMRLFNMEYFIPCAD